MERLTERDSELARHQAVQQEVHLDKPGQPQPLHLHIVRHHRAVGQGDQVHDLPQGGVALLEEVGAQHSCHQSYHTLGKDRLQIII